MNGGRVEQIGSPRDIYEQPETAFVADFVGSLNALEVTVDELVGDYALARLGEGQRVVIPAGPGVAAGEPVRVAVRPERVRIDTSGETATDGGSRLDGTVREVVYLGMYTQFHVDTPAGSLLSHRLADELLSPFETGSGVVLSWEPEHTAVLS
jgi:spermidine/putrescine transport system ATP-binding protein